MNRTLIAVRANADYAGYHASQTKLEPLKTFALSLGRGDPEIIDHGTRLSLAHVEDGELILEGALRQLESGDTLIVRSLATFSENPHDAHRAVLALMARGVTVFVQLLGGSVAPHVDTIGHVLSMVQDAEERIAEIERDAEERIQQGWDAATEAAITKVNEMVKHGISGDMLVRPEPEPDQPTVGEYLKHMRKEAGINQRDLGERLGLHQSSIARMEATGRSEKLREALAIVDPEYQWDGEDESLYKRASEVLTRAENERNQALLEEAGEDVA
ncbi:helix-turn-helix domain-containing protein [Fodinicurvata halophila]|uniref:Helix-turn-helix domain-containing protein n=1 Tax=Fodinicurvata halophila TaxID=1419723 RepID=A0ABV8URL2_9PROT